jgi:hypothetical protein
MRFFQATSTPWLEFYLLVFGQGTLALVAYQVNAPHSAT